MAAPIINDRDLALQASPYRFAITAVSITSSAGAFKTFKNGGITAPASIVLTATPNIVFTAAAVYTWSYALNAQPTNWIALTTGSTVTISNTSILAIIGDSTNIQYRCVVTENLLNTASGFFTITYSKEVSEPIVVDITRANATISSDSAGVPIGYSNTDTTISVSRGGSALAYSASGGINTFKVDIQADNVARTVGTISNTANTYSISGITNITVDIATVIFIVTVYDASGIAVSPTIGKRITYTKVTNGAVGGDATYSYIETSAPVISKSTSAASITGTHSNITVTGKRVVGSGAPTTYGFLTVTANGDVEATLATASSITTAINNSAGKTNYSIKLYNQATVSGATLLDIDNIPVLFTGSSAIIVALTNDSSTIPTNSAGTAGIYTGTGTEIHTYEGAVELAYDGVGTANGTWKIASTLQSNITIGSITDSGLFATIGAASNIAGDTASISYTVSGVSLGGIAFSQLQTHSFSRAYAGATGATGATGTSGTNGTNGSNGTNGANGTKSITISAFKWGTAIGTFAQAATYTWGGSISAYPAGWTSAAPASTANGETLFQINLTITAIATDTSTAVNWSTAVSNTVGYRLDGTIGPQGNSARVAYIVTTSGTPPATPTALAGDQAPTGWSFTATSVLTAGQFMYQSDGILVTGGNIAWGVPYLSNLKVGSLSALSADIGTLNISSTGSIASLSPVTPFTTRKSYGTGNVPGVFLGYDSTTYKFDIGSATNFLRWTGTTLETQGLVIKNTSGTVILSSGTVPADINNSAVTISPSGALSGAGGGTVTIGGLGYTGALDATYGANTSNLNVGIGLGNKLSNSGPYPGSISGFVYGYDSTGKIKDPIRASYEPWRPTGQGGIYLHYSPEQSPAVGTVSDINEGNNKRYQVIEGQKYEASVYLSTHRCSAYINIAWFTAAGVYISEQSGNSIDNYGAGNGLVNWPRSILITVAPVNAALATVYVRSSYSGLTDPYTFASMWYFATALPSQTVASPWSDSVDPTVIATANSAKLLAEASAATIVNITSDNVLSKGEKSKAISEYQAIDNDYAGINSQANTLGLSNAAYINRVQLLQNYLSSLSPAWNDVNSDTPIDGPTFRQKFLDTHYERQQLLNRIASNTYARLTTRANLVYNGGFENGLSGWIGNTSALTISDGVWGRVAIGFSITGTGVIAQNTYFSAQAGELYTVTGDSLLLNATAGSVYFDIEWLTSTQAIIGDSLQSPILTNHEFSTGETTRLAHAVNVVAPTNAAYGRVRFVWESITGTGVIVGARQIKVERGGLPATPYSADATLPVLQSSANAAKATADASAISIGNITSDNILSKGEKSAAIAEYQALANDYSGIVYQADTLEISRTTYAEQLTTLQNYLNSLSPTWNDTSSDTVIVGTTFRQRFLDVHYAKQLVLNAIAAKAATLANWSSVTGTGKPENNATVGANTSNLNVGLGRGNKLSNSGPHVDSISGFVYGYDSTGKTKQPITASFAPWRPLGQGGVYLQYTSANSPAAGTLSDINEGNNKRYQVVAGQRYEASVYLSTHRCSAYINIAWFNDAGIYIAEQAGNTIDSNDAQGALVNWPRSVLITIAPAGAALASIYVRSGYNGADSPYTFASMWYFATALPSQTVASPWSDSVDPTVIAIANSAKSLADASTAAIVNITSDNVLSKGEKSKAIAEYQAISNDYSGIVSRADSLGIPRHLFVNRVTDLQGYLNSLSPSWNDVNSDTPIDGSTFRQRFLDVHYERQQLLSAIVASAATTATWGNVSGIGRPQDNATVGATFGSNISGKITNANASTFIESAAINNAQIGTLDAQKINTGFLSADRILAGTITAEKLNIGSGKNLLQNSTWIERLGGSSYAAGSPKTWIASTNAVNPIIYATPANFVDYCPIGMEGVDMHQSSAYAADSIIYITTLISVVPNKRYEFSVYSGSHRAETYTQTEWLDAYGNSLSYSADYRITNNENQFGGRSLSSFKQIGHFGVAPVNAVQARFFIIKLSTKNISGYADSHSFLVAPMVSEAFPSQTVFSSYSPAGLTTKITGSGIETNAITADKISVGSLSALSATLGTVTAGTITGSSFATGGFTGYTWPANLGQGGSYMDGNGLLLGNNNNGSTIGFFQVTAGGDVYSRNFSIVGGAATFTGKIKSSSFATDGYYDYSWPENVDQGGAYMDYRGALFGNGRAGATMGYLQITATGSIYAPQFSIAGGVARFAGELQAASGTFRGSLTADAINAVNTINIAGNAVTVPMMGLFIETSVLGQVNAQTSYQLFKTNQTIIVLATYKVLRDGPSAGQVAVYAERYSDHQTQLLGSSGNSFTNSGSGVFAGSYTIPSDGYYLIQALVSTTGSGANPAVTGCTITAFGARK